MMFVGGQTSLMALSLPRLEHDVEVDCQLDQVRPVGRGQGPFEPSLEQGVSPALSLSQEPVEIRALEAPSALGLADVRAPRDRARDEAH